MAYSCIRLKIEDGESQLGIQSSCNKIEMQVIVSFK